MKRVNLELAEQGDLLFQLGQGNVSPTHVVHEAAQTEGRVICDLTGRDEARTSFIRLKKLAERLERPIDAGFRSRFYHYLRFGSRKGISLRLVYRNLR